MGVIIQVLKMIGDWGSALCLTLAYFVGVCLYVGYLSWFITKAIPAIASTGLWIPTPGIVYTAPVIIPIVVLAGFFIKCLDVIFRIEF